jgi:hypothetical protein
VRIIIKRPESNSPLRGRIHLRGLLLRPTSNLLQFGGYSELTTETDERNFSGIGWILKSY